jgi:hypothetical protein
MKEEKEEDRERISIIQLSSRHFKLFNISKGNIEEISFNLLLIASDTDLILPVPSKVSFI